MDWAALLGQRPNGNRTHGQTLSEIIAGDTVDNLALDDDACPEFEFLVQGGRCTKRGRDCEWMWGLSTIGVWLQNDMG